MADGAADEDVANLAVSNNLAGAGVGSYPFVEAAGEGNDEIRTSLTAYTMASYANVERLTYTGSATAN